VLWQAFTAEQPVALLIDEIDKADIEFPNDLLRELDRMEFYCLRDARTGQGAAPPAGVHHLQQRKGTARRLPAPLLLPLHQVPRRRHDAANRRRALPGLKKELLAGAMKTFYDVRNLPGLKKKPSTSELLDWLKLLVAEDIPLEALQSAGRQGERAAAGGRAAEERAGRDAVRKAGVHEPAQPLKDRGVRLEPLALGHEDGLRAAAADGQLWRIRVTSVPEPDQTRAYIDAALQARAEGQRFAFAVIDAASGRVLGTTSFHDILPTVRRVEIGYTWYAKSVQRTHVNTTAKLLMMGHAFDTLGCHVVGWRTDNFNFASASAPSSAWGPRKTA
jgi:RimJ/RimL family protein N-acetyltransferase